MKKHIALFMVALIAVAVLSTAGVATAAKKDKPYTINIDRDSVTWTDPRYNVHSAGVFAQIPMTATHSESSSGNTATIDLTADPGETGAVYAEVGVQWKWKGITDWEQVKSKQVTVTVDATYDVVWEGSPVESQGPETFLWAGVADPVEAYLHHPGSINKRVTSMTEPYLNVDLVTDANGIGLVNVLLVGKVEESNAAQHMYGTVTVHSITIRVHDLPAFTAPALLSPANYASDPTELSWEPVTGANYYTVRVMYWDTPSQLTKTAIVYVGPDTSLDVASFTDGISSYYGWSVQASNTVTGQTSEYSAWRYFYT